MGGPEALERFQFVIYGSVRDCQADVLEYAGEGGRQPGWS